VAAFSFTEKHVSFLKALADPCRLEILHLLFEGEMCVCSLAARLGLDPSVVSHHLAVLRRRGILVDRKEGRRIFYSLHPGFYRRENDTDSVEGALPSAARKEEARKRFEEGRSALCACLENPHGPPPRVKGKSLSSGRRGRSWPSSGGAAGLLSASVRSSP